MTTYKLYSEMTDAEKAAIDADEDRREARKASYGEPHGAAYEKATAADEAATSDKTVLPDGVDGDFGLDYTEWWDKAEAEGFSGNFKSTCEALCSSKGIVAPTPAEWVEAAEDVYWMARAAEAGDDWGWDL